MAKKFDIGDFAKAVNEKIVSKSDTETVIQYIDLDDLEENEDNFYGVRDLDTLVSSIEMDGLQQPIVVTRDEDKYKIISGHRRRAAIAQLVADGKEEFRRVPCIVREYKSKAMADLQMIHANSTARVLSSAETAKQAEKVELLLYQLQEEGYTFPGRMRDQVAAACNVSAAKLGRLKVIRKGLQPVWMELFEADKLPESTAYAIARMPGGLQERIYKVAGADVGGGTMERILSLSETTSWLPRMSCPDGTECRRGDSFLRHDIEDPWDPCLGEKCCLTCSRAKAQYSPCERMCSKAKKIRKDARDDANAKEDARKKALSDQYKAETQVYAQRLLRAIEAAGLSDDTSFPWDYYRSYDVATVRKYAAGEFPEGSVWTSAYLSPDRCNDPAKTASVLCCSTDYLLGVSDELTQYPVENPVETVETGPAESHDESNDFYPQWRTGVPPVSCEVVGAIELGDGEVHKYFLQFDAQSGNFFLEDSKFILSDNIRWLPLPKEENEDA